MAVQVVGRENPLGLEQQEREFLGREMLVVLEVISLAAAAVLVQ
jgi:hypothetical protein